MEKRNETKGLELKTYKNNKQLVKKNDEVPGRILQLPKLEMESRTLARKEYINHFVPMDLKFQELSCSDADFESSLEKRITENSTSRS